MALPIILVDSNTGSDTLASGAGPGTALTGSAATTDGTGLVVTLDGSPDLSGIATDGSHVIFLNDSTAGKRNFGKITAADNAAKTVTVADAFALSASGKAWAIGGKRASIGSTTSLKLIDNNAAAGDAMPGWVIELQSAHSETIAATTTLRRAGDTTNGPITLRGKSGAATRPLLTYSNNGNALALNQSQWQFLDFEMQNSNATKTASVAFNFGNSAGNFLIRNVKVSHSTNKFFNACSMFSNASNWVIEDCEFGYCAGVGIVRTGGSCSGLRIENNWIHDCVSDGIQEPVSTTTFNPLAIIGNIIAFNGGNGITLQSTSTTAFVVPRIQGNVIHGNTGDGLKIGATSAQLGELQGLLIEDNRFTFNGGYGINFSGSGINDAVLNAYAVKVRNNNFVTNTSGKYFPTTLTISLNETTTDPSGGLATATKDYAGTVGGSNFMSSVGKGLGYPIGGTLAVGTSSSSYNYQDIGLQHQDAGGGGLPWQGLIGKSIGTY